MKMIKAFCKSVFETIAETTGEMIAFLIMFPLGIIGMLLIGYPVMWILGLFGVPDNSLWIGVIMVLVMIMDQNFMDPCKQNIM